MTKIIPLSVATDQFQREHIKAAVKTCGDNPQAAAIALGIHLSTLYAKLRQQATKRKGGAK